MMPNAKVLEEKKAVVASLVEKIISTSTICAASSLTATISRATHSLRTLTVRRFQQR